MILRLIIRPNLSLSIHIFELPLINLPYLQFNCPAEPFRLNRCTEPRFSWRHSVRLIFPTHSTSSTIPPEVNQNSELDYFKEHLDRVPVSMVENQIVRILIVCPSFTKCTSSIRVRFLAYRCEIIKDNYAIILTLLLTHTK